MATVLEDTKPKLVTRVEVTLSACRHSESEHTEDVTYETGEFTLHLDTERGIIDVVAPCGEAQASFRVADLEEAIKILKANTPAKPKGRRT